MTIRTILVDDEPLAIQGLQLRLSPHEDVDIIETCLNGREAIRAIKTHKPDLVFLGIQMPGFDGFSVIQGLMEVEPPLFVFVTAYQDHAIRAFDAQAVDYLLKPVDEQRLADTLDRVRQRLADEGVIVGGDGERLDLGERFLGPQDGGEQHQKGEKNECQGIAMHGPQSFPRNCCRTLAYWVWAGPPSSDRRTSAAILPLGPSPKRI